MECGDRRRTILKNFSFAAEIFFFDFQTFARNSREMALRTLLAAALCSCTGAVNYQAVQPDLNGKPSTVPTPRTHMPIVSKIIISSHDFGGIIGIMASFGKVKGCNEKRNIELKNHAPAPTHQRTNHKQIQSEVEC